MTGLRLQILSSLALLTALLSGLLAVTLLGMATTSVEHSLSGHIDTIQESAATNIGKLLSVGASSSHVDEMATSWLETGSIDGIWIFDGSGDKRAEFLRDDYRQLQLQPVIPTGARSTEIAATGPGAATSRFLQVPAGRGLGCVIVGTDMSRLTAPMKPVRSLMILYLVLHGIMILTFSYVALTLLIVRPVEKLRSAAQKLGEGQFDVPIDTRSGGKEIRDLAMALSVTARELESQRRDLESKIEQLENAQAEIRTGQEAIVRSEKLASVGRLAAGVAHEIGNPLSVILGFLDLMGSPKTPENERSEYIERMQKEAERVNRIIKDLLSYSRTSQQQLELVDLKQTLEGAISMLAPQKVMKGVGVDLNCADSLPRVLATRDRMTQVFVNLLLNAAEAMVGDGHIVIRMARPEGSNMVHITFTDDGPGIDGDVIEQIFEPFVTSKPEHEGTGLGLAVCHGIIHGFDGSLCAKNGPDGGAVFTIELPARELDDETSTD